MMDWLKVYNEADVIPFIKAINKTHQQYYSDEWYRGWGYPHIFQFYGSVGQLECIFMALLTLSNEGAPAHFFHLMEAPTMRLPNVKMLLCWSSRMQIHGFVENHTFLEQFVSMGVPTQFSNLGVPAQFSSLRGTSTIFQSGGTSTFLEH